MVGGAGPRAVPTVPGLCLTRLSLARRPGQNSRGLEAGRPGRRLADTPGDGARSGHLSDDGEGVGVREKWAWRGEVG